MSDRVESLERARACQESTAAPTFRAVLTEIHAEALSTLERDLMECARAGARINVGAILHDQRLEAERAVDAAMHEFGRVLGTRVGDVF